MEPKILLKNDQGKTIVELAKPDLRAVYDAGWKQPERFVVKAADNATNLYGVMWKPSDFNPNKKYPIISVVYPGPYFGFVPTGFFFIRQIQFAYGTIGIYRNRCRTSR